MYSEINHHKRLCILNVNLFTFFLLCTYQNTMYTVAFFFVVKMYSIKNNIKELMVGGKKLHTRLLVRYYYGYI